MSPLAFEKISCIAIYAGEVSLIPMCFTRPLLGDAYFDDTLNDTC